MDVQVEFYSSGSIDFVSAGSLIPKRKRRGWGRRTLGTVGARQGLLIEWHAMLGRAENKSS
jgi:hypothetical protein